MKTSQSFRSEVGSSMVVVLMVLATLSACILASFNYTATVSRDVERSNTMRRCYEIGDGALDYSFAYWREICRVPKSNVQLPTANFQVITAPSATLFPAVTNFTSSTGPNPASGTRYTIANFKVVATDQMYVPMSDVNALPAPQSGMSPGTSNYNYLASADVTLTSVGSTPLTVNLRRIFTKALLSPWNYAIFYVDDLELHPGASMNVTGWVHTNSNFYTAHNTLNFSSKVSYGNDWAMDFKPGDSRLGTETPTNPTWQSNLPPFRDQGQQPFGLDSTRLFSATDSNPNNDSYRELIEVPDPSNPDPVSGQRYYDQAGVKIIVDNPGKMTFYRQDGTVISASSPAGSTDLKLYQAFSSAVAVGATITDKREGATVRLMDVDVSVINTKLTASGAPSFNGILYISDQSAASNKKRAVRLKNGAVIPPGGLTVATDNGLYIQGDYNTGSTSTVQPPSNSVSAPDFTKPTLASYTRQPCAVLADAVMILSNAWTDANSSAALSTRNATPTTVNTAIVSGIVATTGTALAPGNYSGGAENFPRFLEDWSSDSFTYYGSMVELYQSQQFNTAWPNTGAGPNVYNPPNRQWNFDTNFYTTPPPGTLTLVSYNKGRWYVQ